MTQRIQETYTPSRNVTAKLDIETINGKSLDTHVDLKGDFWVEGARRKEFIEALGDLIEEFRI